LGWGIPNMWSFLTADPLLLGHVIQRMRSDCIYSKAKVNEQLFRVVLGNQWSCSHKNWPRYQAS